MGGGVLRISSFRDDRRIFWTVFDCGIFWGKKLKFSKYCFGWHDLSRDFLVYSEGLNGVKRYRRKTAKNLDDSRKN